MAALTEEQTLLKEQAKTWAKEEAPVSKFREMRDSGTEAGFDKSVWLPWRDGLGRHPDPRRSRRRRHGPPDIRLGSRRTRPSIDRFAFARFCGRRSVCDPAGRRREPEKRVASEPRRRKPIVTLAIDESTRHAPQQTALSAKSTRRRFHPERAKSPRARRTLADALWSRLGAVASRAPKRVSVFFLWPVRRPD